MTYIRVSSALDLNFAVKKQESGNAGCQIAQEWYSMKSKYADTNA